MAAVRLMWACRTAFRGGWFLDFLFFLAEQARDEFLDDTSAVGRDGWIGALIE